MNYKTYTMMFAVGALALLPACSGDDNEEPKAGPRHVIALSEQQKNDVAEVNEFGYRLWNNIQAIDDSRNDFYSPLGVHFVLSMLANGAEGETLQQITDLLGSDDLASLNQLDKKLLKELPKVDRTVRMSIANSCWVDKNSSVLSSYSDAMKDVFGSEVMRYSMGTDEAREAVNKWCAAKTNGMIPDFLSENPNYDILLLNALFFQGRWKEPFDKSKTVPGQFRNADGTVSTVDMMNGEITASCAENERATVAFLNYGNSGYYMTLIVPRDGYTLKDMTEEEIFGCIKGMDTYNLKVSMPRFSVTSDYKDIAERITAMGYNRVFTDANYARLFGAAGTAVNGFKVFQKSRIEVDESGTRAAAVTASGDVAGWNSASRITVDRPFLFTISESSTGVVLFMGKVAKL